MAISSKEVIIILLGIVGSTLLGLLLQGLNFNLLNIKEYIMIIGIIIVLVSAIIFVIYKKFREVDIELEKQNNELKNIDNRFKTIEDLNNIKSDIKELQRKILKDGYKNWSCQYGTRYNKNNNHNYHRIHNNKSAFIISLKNV